MMPAVSRLALALLALTTACSLSESDGFPVAEGVEGAPCFRNGTCESGLTCLSGLCVRPEGPGGGTGEGEGEPGGPGEGEGEPAGVGEGEGERPLPGEGEGEPAGPGEGEGEPPGPGEGEGEPPGPGEGEGEPPGPGEGEGEPPGVGEGEGEPPGVGEGEGEGEGEAGGEGEGEDPPPPEGWEDQGNGAVEELATGQWWTQDVVFDSSVVWHAAAVTCDGLQLAGRLNWRLPTIEELERLVVGCDDVPCDLTQGPGAGGCYMDTDVWDGVCGRYWSGSGVDGQWRQAFMHNFGVAGSEVSGRGERRWVRCVADAPACAPGDASCNPAAEDYCANVAHGTPCTPEFPEGDRALCLDGECMDLGCGERMDCNSGGVMHPPRRENVPLQGPVDGVVYDLATGFEWSDAVSAGSADWQAAPAYCAGLGLDGGGWRLPDRAELMALSDLRRGPPRQRSGFSEDWTSYLWSSTAFPFGQQVWTHHGESAVLGPGPRAGNNNQVPATRCIRQRPGPPREGPSDRWAAAPGEAVDDTVTALRWARPVATRVTHLQAETYCTDGDFDGEGADWDLPTLRQVLSLVDDRYFDPPLHPLAEPTIGVDSIAYRDNAHAWTATVEAGRPDFRYVMYLAGVARPGQFTTADASWSNGYHARCVRELD